MVLANTDSRQNQNVKQHVGPESYYANDVSETGKKKCYAFEDEMKLVVSE